MTPEAQDQLFHEIENRQTVSVVDIEDIVNSILELGLAEQVQKYCRRKKHPRESNSGAGC